jgi:hypothetical protein
MTVEIRANFPPEQWPVEIASMRVLDQNLASHTVIASSSKLDRRSLFKRAYILIPIQPRKNLDFTQPAWRR